MSVLVIIMEAVCKIEACLHCNPPTGMEDVKNRLKDHSKEGKKDYFLVVPY